MKLLSDILYKTRLEEIIGSTNVAISSVTFDSRKVKKDSLIIATRGTASDVHHYIELAIENWAVAVVFEYLPETLKENVTYVKVLDSSASLGYIACNFTIIRPKN